MIRSIPSSERPREKLINNGVSSLSDSELLSIILKSGTKGRGVNELAYELLNNYEDLSTISKMECNELMKVHGIGIVKAIELVACFELGRRSMYKKNDLILTGNDVYKLFFEKLAYNPQEELHVILLNKKKEIIATKLISKGSIDSALIYPRDILREAFKVNAVGIILVHNHPSGDTLPSVNDKSFTNDIRELAKTLGLNVIDHVIIGYNSYYSFYDHGW